MVWRFAVPTNQSHYLDRYSCFFGYWHLLQGQQQHTSRIDLDHDFQGRRRYCGDYIVFAILWKE